MIDAMPTQRKVYGLYKQQAFPKRKFPVIFYKLVSNSVDMWFKIDSTGF